MTRERIFLFVRRGSDIGRDSDAHRHAGTDLRLSSETIIFTPENWEVYQTVTVTAVHDDDAVDDEVTLTLTASGGGFAGTVLTVKVKVIDDDAAGLEVVPAKVEVDEGNAGGIDVRLATQPTTDVIVAVSGHTGTDLRLMPEALTFTRNNWDEDQRMLVSAVHDDDAVDDEETLTLTASGGGFGGVTAMVAVTIIDDDEAVTLRIADTQPVSESAGEVVFESR